MTKQEFFSNISCFIEKGNVTDIQNLKVPSEKSSILLYNTDDLWLSKSQFEALIKLLSFGEKLYAAQNDSEEIYEMTAPLKYENYENLNLFSISFIASEKFEWVIVIDEGLESGTGVLVGEPDFIQKYIHQYGHALKDIYDLIAFHYNDSSRNPRSIDNLVKILSLGHPFIT